MADQSVFNAPVVEPVVTAAVVTPVVDTELDTLLDSIKNSDGKRKYANVQEALKGLANAQAFIPDLQSKLTLSEQKAQHLEQELAKRQSVEDTLAAITAAKKEPDGLPPVAGLDTQSVTSLVDNILSHKEAQKVALTNEKAVNDTLITKYGEKVREVVAAKADELGMTIQDLGKLAQRSPNAVLAFFDAKVTPKPNLSTTSINTANLQKAPPQEGVQRPAKSILSGATTKQQIEHMREHKKAVYAKFGVEE